MATRQRKKSLLNRFILPVFSVAFLGYFGFHSFHGSYGLIGYQSIKGRIHVLEKRLAAVSKDREALELQANLLTPGSPDKETVDELARAKLNVVHPNEVVFLLDY